MLQKMKKFFDEKGQGMVEYALILAFVVVVAVVLTGNDSIKSSVENVFNNIKTALTNSGGANGT